MTMGLPSNSFEAAILEIQTEPLVTHPFQVEVYARPTWQLPLYGQLLRLLRPTEAAAQAVASIAPPIPDAFASFSSQLSS